MTGGTAGGARTRAGERERGAASTAAPRPAEADAPVRHAASPALLVRAALAAPVPLAPSGVLRLQGVIGNRAVTRLLRGAVPALQRGGKLGKEAAPVYETVGNDIAKFEYRVEENAAGGKIEVFTKKEAGSIGRASFSFEDMAQVAGPDAAEPYTKAHVLGREAGLVCHLTGIYNQSLTRDGPANIYRGFANTLMQMVEDRARQRGARLIYLEPANSLVRKSPNDNEKQIQDPTDFYVSKHGYGYDAAAAQHNTPLARQGAAARNLDQAQTAAEVNRFIRVAMEGMLSKAL